MLYEKIINIDFAKIGNAIDDAEEPKVIVMSETTLLSCLSDDPDLFEENETEYGTSFSLKGIPVSLNPEFEYGYVLVK